MQPGKLRAPGFGGSGPPEWGGLTPFFDWDPVNATSVAGVYTAIPDSSGNARHAIVGGSGIVGPLVATDFGGKPVFSWPADVERRVLSPVAVPAGPFGLAFVGYSGGGVVSNFFGASGQSDSIGLYAARAGDQAWHGWASPSFAEPTSSFDFSTTPTVLLLTSSGESSLGANDATVRFYAKSRTPSSIAGQAPKAAGAIRLGENFGSPGPANCLHAVCARFIVWSGVDPSSAASAILNALGAAYAVGISP